MLRRVLRNLGCVSALSAFALALFAQGQQAARPTCNSTVVGDLHVLTFRSVVFNDEQTVRVWLPPGYVDSTPEQRAYPVLYMLDGQNLFDVCTSPFGHEWQIDETLTRLIKSGAIEPIIVVGIDASTTRRPDEYIPFPDAIFATPPSPHGVLFPSFLIEEVMPFVSKQFRIKTGPANTAIGGSSYGSVAALYALITRPDVFGLGLLESTSLQVGNGELLRLTQSLMVGPRRVYVGVGTEELGGQNTIATDRALDPTAFNAGMVKASQQLASNLKSAALNTPQVMFASAPGAHHEEAAWAVRFPTAIQFLFPRQPQ
jgi:predicted alpha/beta superfamily hydrolase